MVQCLTAIKNIPRFIRKSAWFTFQSKENLENTVLDREIGQNFRLQYLTAIKMSKTLLEIEFRTIWCSGWPRSKCPNIQFEKLNKKYAVFDREIITHLTLQYLTAIVKCTKKSDCEKHENMKNAVLDREFGTYLI